MSLIHSFCTCSWYKHVHHGYWQILDVSCCCEKHPDLKKQHRGGMLYLAHNRSQFWNFRQVKARTQGASHFTRTAKSSRPCCWLACSWLAFLYSPEKWCYTHSGWIVHPQLTRKFLLDMSTGQPVLCHSKTLFPDVSRYQLDVKTNQQRRHYRLTSSSQKFLNI